VGHLDIAATFKERGTLRVLSVITPFLADNPSKAYYILKGKVNISSCVSKDGQPFGRLDNFTSFNEGELIMGSFPSKAMSLSFLVDAEEETQIVVLDEEDLKDMQKQEEFQKDLAKLIDQWILRLFEGVADDTSIIPPPTDETIIARTSVKAEAGLALETHRENLWLEFEDRANFLFNTHIENEDGPGLVPIASNTAFQLKEDSIFHCYSTSQVIGNELIWKSLHFLIDQVLKSDEFERRYRSERETERITKKYKLQDEEFTQSLGRISKVFKRQTGFDLDFGNADPMFAACTLVARFDKIDMVQPDEDRKEDELGQITRYSKVRYREILLEPGWYKENTEDAFLAFLEEGDPVAVIPDGKGGLKAVNTFEREVFTITAENAEKFADEAYHFYKPFPSDKKIGIKDIALFSFSRNKRDFAFVLAMGFIGALLGLVAPVLSAQIFDFVIPSADKFQLLTVALALFAVSIAGMNFDLVKSYALLRVQGRMDYKLQSALWDRLMDLPTEFFKQYNVGDLASRSMGINQIREILSGAVIASLLAGVFSIMNLGLLIYYDVSLALLAIGVSAIQVAMIIYFSRLQLRKQKVLLDEQGKLSGVVFQVLNGIARFRASGAESMAFLHWFRNFMSTKTIAIDIYKIQNQQAIFSGAFSLLSTMFVYFTVIKLAGSLTTGEFIAFIGAYGGFVAAIVGMSGSLTSALQVPILFKRLEPILETKPESNQNKEAPGPLQGRIEINNVSFRYQDDSPLILNDVSIKIDKGDYIALVGPSGSGKSTLIRLLLGFNAPEVGSIFYDGLDLDRLEPKLLRRQIGVVLQDGSLVAGDIYSNIIGASTQLDIRHAWAAARAAAFDRDIRTMPMGMHTIVNEDGGTLSGGQKQRLMIARALVHKPKILIFDEATSALDNETQAIVTQSLDQLNVTRIVVAHRLSTIINANRIYYLEGGKMIESGSYEELMALQGRFFKMAERQLE
jgi:NHLM bacteriocin system ABC transporter ATP-binding protein